MYKNQTHGVFVMGFDLVKCKNLTPKISHIFGT